MKNEKLKIEFLELWIDFDLSKYQMNKMLESHVENDVQFY